ncbi:MAG: translation initiation factor IF-2 [Proteobacteria bacterium]|nr:translation initiation factor IF-2 [Pseudomonadota bacterium]
MTEDNNQNTTRSRLTLKLPTSVNTQNLVLKTGAKKKLSSSSVQVTIKGRKKESGPSEKAEGGLSRNEMEARIRAVSSGKDVESEIKTHEILSKANKKVQKEEEIIVEEEKIFEAVHVQPEPQQHIIPDYKLDQFDVRSKIRQSVEVANREKEEREKLAEERRKLEQQRLAKEREERDKKKQKKLPLAKKSFEEDSKKKPAFKEEHRVNSRRLTYIIDTDSEIDSSGRKRKKSRDSRHHQEQDTSKEYKKIQREVALPELITVADLAERMSEKVGDVVKKLFAMGMVVTSNQAVDADTAEIIISEFGHKAKRTSHSDVENILEEGGEEYDFMPRAPIVTIMGHVDHGKTSLLDALRETDVAAREHGGITQHIGASRIKTVIGGKFITFLDTPGHEAFTEMRSRGANVTDIVVLVVAADDGVKEQTIEAINHAKAANVPIIVAVNKIDKTGSDPERVKNELLSHEIVSEDLGGEVMFIPVSAKSKKNLDKLEEAILLQAEVLDLKSQYEGKASGVVLESRIDPSRGVVATLLVQKGTLNTSDLIVVGTAFGRVRKMSDDLGNPVKSATPSVPVEVLGLDSAPNSGDKFFEVDEERQAREIISYRSRKEKEVKALKNSAKSFSDIFKESGKGKLKYLNIIIKGDVHGSVEAIIGTVAKLNTEEVAIKVVHSATGGISDSDISLAAASGAMVVGFNVRANASAKEMSQTKGIEIRYYSIIYNLVDDLKLLLTGMLKPVHNEEHLGHAEIRQVFKVSGSGKVAGSYVTDGIIKRNARARLLRDNVVIHDGELRTLKRFKEDVKEVKMGFECGIAFENYDDIKEKDVIECYEVVEQKRSL